MVFEKIKINILNWLFNPVFRISLLFLTIFRFLYFYGLFGSPITISALFVSLGLIIITYAVLIVGIECIGEVILNSELNGKQIKFFEKSSVILLIPLSAYLIYNVFTIKEFSFLVITWGLVTSYLIFFTAIKSIRWSFIITWILATIFFVKMSIGSPIIFWSLGLSHFFLILFIRYSEVNPSLWINSKRLEFLEKLNNLLLSKIKENMIKSKEVVFISEEPYFIKENGIYDKFDNKIKDIKLINKANNLIKIKVRFEEIRSNEYMGIFPFSNKIDLPLEFKKKVYKINLFFKKLKFVDHIIF
ncbi:MAG: hypothetical protein WCX73_06120, partial [Candidatus Pacearchaeota archaeon]